MPTLRKLYAFLRLGRPLFLAGGFIFHALGVSIALYQGHSLSWVALIWGRYRVLVYRVLPKIATCTRYTA